MYLATSSSTFLGAPTTGQRDPRDRLHQAMQSVPWLKNLDARTVSQMIPHARLQRHMRNDLVMKQGHEAGQLLVLLEGQVHAERQTQGQRTVLLQVARPFDTLADAALVDSEPVAANYRVVKPGLMLSVQRQAFKEALRRSPELCNAYVSHVSRQVREANVRVHMLACQPVEERVFATLSEWSRRNASGQWVVDQPIAQQDLALVVAASREMTCRALAQLKLKGKIWYDRWEQVVVCRNDD